MSGFVDPISSAAIAAAGGEVTTNKSTDGTFASPSTTTYPSTSAVKTYADNLVAGLKWKQSVVAATTTNGTLATAFANGQTIDGVVLATGNRILLKDQSTGSQNGIYIVAASGAPTRATDADTGTELVSAAVFVEQGTTNAEKAFVCTNNSITIGSTAIVFTLFASITPGITSSAGDGVFPLSDGTNLETSPLSYDGSDIAAIPVGSFDIVAGNNVHITTGGDLPTVNGSEIFVNSASPSLGTTAAIIQITGGAQQASVDINGGGGQITVTTTNGTNVVGGLLVAGNPVAIAAIVSPFSPTTGQTVSAGTFKVDETLYITPAGTLLALTVTLPASANARVGQIIRGFISQIITGLTVNVSGGGTIVGSTPVTSAVNSSFAYQCVSVASTGTWIRIQ